MQVLSLVLFIDIQMLILLNYSSNILSIQLLLSIKNYEYNNKKTAFQKRFNFFNKVVDCNLNFDFVLQSPELQKALPNMSLSV